MQVDSGLLGIKESSQALEKFVQAEERAIKEALEYILRQMVNYVKENGPWIDHTSNLRNSISINIKTMREWPADTPEGTLKALAAQNETPVIEINGTDYIACISAGMEYAIWLETKEGYWVIQGAIDQFEPLIEKYFAGKLSVGQIDFVGAADAQYTKFLSGKGLSESEIGSRIQAKHDFYNGR